MYDFRGNDFNGVGDKFFEGMVNGRYFNQIRTKIDLVLIGHNDKDRKLLLYKAFQSWLSDPILLSSALHAPSLSPVYMPEELQMLLSGHKDVWREFVDESEWLEYKAKGVNEWNKLHFRDEKRKRQSFRSKSGTTPAEDIMKRLKSYDQPLKPPKLTLKSAPIPKIADVILKDENSLGKALTPFVENIKSFAETFTANNMEMASLISSQVELNPVLYENVTGEAVIRVACAGSKGPKGEKFDCSGTATINLEYEEAKKNERVDLKLRQNRDNLHGLIQRMLLPIPVKTASSVAYLDNLTQKLLKLFVKGKASKDLSVFLFYALTELLDSEEAISCSPIRHFISNALETIGNSVIVDDPRQCVPLMKKMIDYPRVSQFLTSSFTPNCVDTETFIEVYKRIHDIPAKDVNLAFVLLSKLRVDEWLRKRNPPTKSRSRLISLLGKALNATGRDPTDRRLIHGLHRSHLIDLAFGDFPR